MRTKNRKLVLLMLRYERIFDQIAVLKDFRGDFIVVPNEMHALTYNFAQPQYIAIDAIDG